MNVMNRAKNTNYRRRPWWRRLLCGFACREEPVYEKLYSRTLEEEVASCIRKQLEPVLEDMRAVLQGCSMLLDDMLLMHPPAPLPPPPPCGCGGYVPMRSTLPRAYLEWLIERENYGESW